MGKLVLCWIGLLLAVVYVLNPTAGIFELVPDVGPGIGNLDEAAAVGLGIACWRAIRARRAERLAASGGVRIQPSPPNRAGTPRDPTPRS
jgi:uncharacterized membrane protein YkvA (DUF1232 family)